MSDGYIKDCPRRGAPCHRGCSEKSCKTQAERDMGLSMPPAVIPIPDGMDAETFGRAFTDALKRHMAEMGIVIGAEGVFIGAPTSTC
jgi:hypothetical protein